MRKFAGVRDFCREVLDEAGFSADGPSFVSIHPGPDLPQSRPSMLVVLTPYGGPGLDTGEGILDVRGWQVRCVGTQNDQTSYETAESIAEAIDLAMISHESSMVGDSWVASIQRAGGPPAVLMTDDAGCTHFVCSYLVSVESALAN